MSPAAGQPERLLLHPGVALPVNVNIGTILVVVDEGVAVSGLETVEVGATLTMNRPARLVRGGDGVLRFEPVALPSEGGDIVTRAARIFDWAGAALPTRLANEELGDALEDIARRASLGQSKWLIYFKMVTSVLWTAVHAVQHGWRQVEHRKGGS